MLPLPSVLAIWCYHLPLNQGSTQPANKRPEVGVGTPWLFMHTVAETVCCQPFCLQVVGVRISAFSALLFVFLPSDTCQRAQQKECSSIHRIKEWQRIGRAENVARSCDVKSMCIVTQREKLRSGGVGDAEWVSPCGGRELQLTNPSRTEPG